MRHKIYKRVKYNSLFPDYSILETGRNEAQAMRLAQQLHEVGLQMLATDSDRRLVVSRLLREGIDNAMHLILLTEEEVRTWRNVGPVFVEILASMTHEITANPEHIVDEWLNLHRLYILPDDLEMRKESEDFFGTLMANEEETIYPKEKQPSVLSQDNQDMIEFERCIIAAIEMLEHRHPYGLVLRRFFIDGYPTDAIVQQCGLASSTSLFRIVDKFFITPLLQGYPVKGIQFSEELLQKVSHLRKDLLYQRAEVVNMLHRIPPTRFLHLLGLTLLQRTTAERLWGGDYIVREGEVLHLRYVLHRLIASLQWRVTPTKESSLRKGITKPGNFFRALLKTHPCIEQDRKGYRLVSEHLTYDCARIARIVYDAHSPITTTDILTQYEHRYMERPLTLSISDIRKRFPRIHSIQRGVWQWK